MINQKIINTLRAIIKELKGKKIRWVLVGSTSLALQKVKIKPKDIDILTDRKGAFKLNKLLKKYEIRPVKFGRSEIFKSYFGEFRINDIKIEVMGDLEERINNKWTTLSKRLMIPPKIVEIKKMKIPVSSLMEQLEAYKKLGRKKDSFRVRKIKEVLGKGK